MAKTFDDGGEQAMKYKDIIGSLSLLIVGISAGLALFYVGAFVQSPIEAEVVDYTVVQESNGDPGVLGIGYVNNSNPVEQDKRTSFRYLNKTEVKEIYEKTKPDRWHESSFSAKYAEEVSQK